MARPDFNPAIASANSSMQTGSRLFLCGHESDANVKASQQRILLIQALTVCCGDSSRRGGLSAPSPERFGAPAT
jgi:hypothetical protein